MDTKIKYCKIIHELSNNDIDFKFVDDRENDISFINNIHNILFNNCKELIEDKDSYIYLYCQSIARYFNAYIDSALKYCLRSIENNNNYCPALLLYAELLEITNMDATKYYEMAIEKGSLVAILKFAVYLNNTGKYIDSEIFFKKAIEQKVPNSSTEYANFLTKIKRSDDEVIKYYKNGIDNNDIDALAKYTSYMININKDEVLNIFKTAVEEKDYALIFEYANILNKEGKYDQVDRYYRNCVVHGKKHFYKLVYGEFLCSRVIKYEDAMLYLELYNNNFGKKQYSKYITSLTALGYSDDTIKPYYLFAINNYEDNSCLDYAKCCEKNSKNDDAKKYYEMHIERCKSKLDGKAEFIYATFLEKINDPNANKYYLLSINNNNDAIISYAIYLQGKDNDEADKYFKLGIEKQIP